MVKRSKNQKSRVARVSNESKGSVKRAVKRSLESTGHGIYDRIGG